MAKVPTDGQYHITYQLQYRKCGKTNCSTCRSGQRHGPYWYAYWREGSRLRSGYVGKISPEQHRQKRPPRVDEATCTERCNGLVGASPLAAIPARGATRVERLAPDQKCVS